LGLGASKEGGAGTTTGSVGVSRATSLAGAWGDLRSCGVLLSREAGTSIGAGGAVLREAEALAPSATSSHGGPCELVSLEWVTGWDRRRIASEVVGSLVSRFANIGQIIGCEGESTHLLSLIEQVVHELTLLKLIGFLLQNLLF